MSRRRSKKDNNKWLTVVIVVLCVCALGFFIYAGSSSSENSSCGTREEDAERSGYCVTSSKDYDELVIVAGNTKNTPAPDLDFTQGELYDILGGVFYNAERGATPNISIISVAGSNHTIEYTANHKVAQNIIASNNELKNLAKN